MTGSYGCQSACRQSGSADRVRQLGHLTFHTVFLVVKPPAEPNCILPGIPSPWKLPIMVPALRYRAGSGSREWFSAAGFLVLLAQQLR